MKKGVTKKQLMRVLMLVSLIWMSFLTVSAFLGRWHTIWGASLEWKAAFNGVFYAGVVHCLIFLVGEGK